MMAFGVALKFAEPADGEVNSSSSATNSGLPSGRPVWVECRSAIRPQPTAYLRCAKTILKPFLYYLSSMQQFLRLVFLTIGRFVFLIF